MILTPSIDSRLAYALLYQLFERYVKLKQRRLYDHVDIDGTSTVGNDCWLLRS